MTGAAYGHDHQQRRARLLPQAYNQPCPICGKPMLRGEDLDLDADPEAAGIGADLLGFVEKDFQERGRPRIPVGPHVSDRPDLQLGLSGATRNDGAAERLRARLDHRARRRQMVRVAVVHDVAFAEARREDEQPDQRPDQGREEALLLVEEA